MLITINRPWGVMKLLESSTNYWVKIITVNPRQRLSLQSHNHRDELWFIVSGAGQVQIENENYHAIFGQEFTIYKKEKHRIMNTSEYTNLKFIEIAFGVPNEDDIIRYEDDYNRT